MTTRSRITSYVARVLVLARAEVLHVVRDRASLVQVLVVPIVQLLILSNAATFAIRDTPLSVVDYDHSSASRGLVSRLLSSGYFDLVDRTAAPETATDLMLRGRVSVILTIPNDFEASLFRLGTAPVHLDVNAEKGAAAGVVTSYIVRILDAYSAELRSDIRPSLRSVRDVPAGATMPIPGAGRIVTETRHLYNPGLNYKHYMVPGILVALVTMIGTLLTAQNIAREKEMGTLEQLNVTPITRAEFITAKLLPFWVLAFINLSIGLVLARVVYDVPMRGSLVLLFACAGVYLLVALGIGLWISTAVETQQQAMFVTFFILMIYLLMSGMFTPVDSMPRWVQVLSELNPVRHFVTIIRGILVKGAGISEIARPLGILAVSAAVVLSLAIHQYQKRDT